MERQDGEWNGLGAEIRRLRLTLQQPSGRKVSQAQLLDWLERALEAAGIEYEVRGDGYIETIEHGTKRKPLSRTYVEAFAAALRCNEMQTVRLLLLAGINLFPITDDDQPDFVTPGLLLFTAKIFPRLIELATPLINDARAELLTEAEWILIGKDALEMLLEEIDDVLAGLV